MPFPGPHVVGQRRGPARPSVAGTLYKGASKIVGCNWLTGKAAGAGIAGAGLGGAGLGAAGLGAAGLGGVGLGAAGLGAAGLGANGLCLGLGLGLGLWGPVVLAGVTIVGVYALFQGDHAPPPRSEKTSV
ncbi:MAG: hypothetical protein WCP29_06210 [Acidobacteriota bacterium]